MSETLKLWFFRDLTDDQRLKLFGLFGLSVDDIGPNHGRQSTALRQITQKLIEMVRDEVAPAPAANVRGNRSMQPGFGFDHCNELGAGHSSGFGDADLAHESDEPDRTTKLNSEVGGCDHLRIGSRWLHEKITAIGNDLLPNLVATALSETTPPKEVKLGALFHQPWRWTISRAIGRVQSSTSSVTPLWKRSKSWLATICASRLSGRMFRSAQRASIARVSFSISPESRKSNMSSLPSETTSLEEYWKTFSTAQDAKNKEIASSSTGSCAFGDIIVTGETT